MAKCAGVPEGSCGKEMSQGYTVIENKFYCPDCAAKHPVTKAAEERRQKEEMAAEIEAEAMWKQVMGDIKTATVRGKEITKDEFVEIMKRRRRP